MEKLPIDHLKEHVTDNFTWAEALTLHNWGFAAVPSAHIHNNIIKTCVKLELIRSFFGDKPIRVLSFFRPAAYNAAVKGSAQSAHIDGLACDFVVKDIHSHHARLKLLKKLDEFGIRMERLPEDHNWVHIDLIMPLGDSRYFFP